MKLWLDDIFPSRHSSFEPALTDWVWARNSVEFQSLLRLYESKLTTISFDNDLGEKLEGRDCFGIVEQMLHDGKLKKLKTLIIHTSNPATGDSMMLAKDSMNANFGIKMMRLPRST